MPLPVKGEEQGTGEGRTKNDAKYVAAKKAVLAQSDYPEYLAWKEAKAKNKENST